MTKELAKEIITEYVFADYKLESVYPFVDKMTKTDDELERKGYAEALLNHALQEAVIALSEQEN